MVTNQDRIVRGGRRPAGGGVFSAIADPTRRAILDRLAGGPMPAGEVAEGFEMSRPAVSKHLRALESAGLVSARRRGRERVYEARSEPLGEVERWLTQHRLRLAAGLVAIKKHAEAAAEERNEQ